MPEIPKKDAEREERISMEIVVDAHDEEERSLGWYYYLENMLGFPFKARCVARVATSPLKVGETVKVTGFPSEEVCERDMYVLVKYGRNKDALAVPLSQLEPVDADEDTTQAVEDWHYWCARGYEF